MPSGTTSLSCLGMCVGVVRALMTNTFTCPDRSDDSANAFWLSNTNNVVVGNVGIAQHIAFRIETRHVMGLVRRRFPLEAEKVGRRGKLKGNIRLERFQDNVAHSSRFGFFNYPLLNLPNGAERGYEGLVVWRCGTGISVHNSKQPLLINDTRLVEVGVGIRAGQSRARVALSNTQIIARDPDQLAFCDEGLVVSKGRLCSSASRRLMLTPGTGFAVMEASAIPV